MILNENKLVKSSYKLNEVKLWNNDLDRLPSDIRQKVQDAAFYSALSDANDVYDYVTAINERVGNGSRYEDVIRSFSRGLASVGSAMQLVRAGLLNLPGDEGKQTPYGTKVFEPAEKQQKEKAKELRISSDLLWQISNSPELAMTNNDIFSKATDLIGQTLPYIGATIAGGLVAGPAGAFAVGAAVEGNSAYRTALDEGVDEQTAKTIGVGVGIISGAIEAVGFKGVENFFEKTALKYKNNLIKRGIANFSSATIVEALEEGSQEIAQITGEKIYRDVNWNEAVTRVLGSMAGGAFLGGAMKGGGIALRRAMITASEKPTAQAPAPPPKTQKAVAPAATTTPAEAKTTTEGIETTPEAGKEGEKQPWEMTKEEYFEKRPDYGMEHRPTYEGMPPSYNLLEGGAIPDDVYEHPEWSIAGGRNFKTDKAAQESWQAIQKIRNKPESEITVYRATQKEELNIGDWVTFSKEYAKQSKEGSEKVYSFKVKAKDVIFAGDDINEFGYYPSLQHVSIVQQAIKEGKPVPRAVLEEYKGEAWADEALTQQPTPPVEYRREQMGGTAEETITPNLYIGNVTEGMKKRIAESGEFNLEDVKGFTEGGFPTKRTKIKMTRSEAGNYLSWAMKFIDNIVQQVEEKGSVSLTYNQLAMTQALIGDIKALQEALGYTVQPAEITFRQAGKRKTAIVGKPTISDKRFNEITRKIEKGEELTEQDQADMEIALKEEQAFNKALMKLNIKQSIKQAIRPQEPSGKSVYEVLKAVMKGKEQAAQKAYLEAGRDMVKQHKNLANIAKDQLADLKISEAKRNQLLNAVSRARTDKEQVAAMASVLAVRDDAILKDQKNRFKSLIKQIPKYGKEKALSDVAEQRLEELMQDIDVSKLSKNKREQLEEVKKDLIKAGFDIADKFSETPQEELEGIEEVVGKNALENLKRMDKVAFADMTVNEREELIDTLDYILSQNTKERQEYIKEQSEIAKQDVQKSKTEVIPTKKSSKVDTSIAGKRISLAKRIYNLLTLDSMKRWSLIEMIVGKKGKHTIDVLDKNIHKGKVESVRITQNAVSFLQTKMKEIGWGKSDIERIDLEHTVTLGGKQYQLTTSEIMSLGMNMRWKRNLNQITKAESLWIGGREVNTPTVGEIYDALEVLSNKEKAFMDLVPLVNEQILMPEVNKTSKKLFGFGLAKEKNYWGLKRKIEKTVRGKVIEGPAIEDLGMFQPFRGGTAPLIIKPFFEQMFGQIQNSASFAGMALPMKRARTLLNNKDWRKAVDNAGRKEQRLRVTEIYRRSQGMANDFENVETIAASLTRRAGKAILGWRIPTMAIQKASLFLAMTYIPTKYTAPLTGEKVQRGKDQTLRMEQYSPFLWLRHAGGRVEIVTGDYAAINSVQNILFNQRTDLSLEGLRKVDWSVMKDIDIMVQRWVSGTTNLKQGSENYWKEVAARTEEVVRKTQPVWDIDERSVLSSSKNPFVKPVFMFRAAREAILNLNIAATDNVLKENFSFASLGQLSETTSATLLSTSLVLLIRKAAYVGTATAIAAMLGKSPPDREKLGLEIDNIALDFVKELFGYLPLGSIPTAFVKKLAGEPIYSELDPDQILYTAPINIVNAVTDFKQAFKAYFKDEDEKKTVIELLDGFNKLIEAIALAKGIPLMGPTQITTKPLVRELKRKEEKKSTRYK